MTALTDSGAEAIERLVDRLQDPSAPLAARRAILEAAQKRLADCGPEEIRLQAIASDLGISHPAILHLHIHSLEMS